MKTGLLHLNSTTSGNLFVDLQLFILVLKISESIELIANGLILSLKTRKIMRFINKKATPKAPWRI